MERREPVGSLEGSDYSFFRGRRDFPTPGGGEAFENMRVKGGVIYRKTEELSSYF